MNETTGRDGKRAEVGVGPYEGPWPADERLDPQLLADGDQRNVIDRYRCWTVEVNAGIAAGIAGHSHARMDPPLGAVHLARAGCPVEIRPEPDCALGLEHLSTLDDHVVDDAVLLGLLCGEPTVAVGVGLDLLVRAARV